MFFSWFVTPMTREQKATNDDCPEDAGTYSCLYVIVTAGSTYAVQVDGYNAAMGQLSLVVEKHAPVNDDYAE
jgi:hypothetical protein